MTNIFWENRFLIPNNLPMMELWKPKLTCAVELSKIHQHDTMKTSPLPRHLGFFFRCLFRGKHLVQELSCRLGPLHSRLESLCLSPGSAFTCSFLLKHTQKTVRFLPSMWLHTPGFSLSQPQLLLAFGKELTNERPLFFSVCVSLSLSLSLSFSVSLSFTYTHRHTF